MHKYTVSIVGARGYSGLELAKILLSHPHVELTHCYATSSFELFDYISHSKAKTVRCLSESDLDSNNSDIVFLATPAEVSLKIAPSLLAKGCKVIDLSGAFRLKNSDYEKWYGFKHSEPELLKKSVYGLLPFVGPHKNQTGSCENLIANPGCYASAVSLALIPLIKENLIFTDSLVIDAKSGTSGAGKKAAENLLFTEVDGECLPYKVGRHQHLPEIQEAVKQFTGIEINPHFTTSLLPVRRGITAAIYANLREGLTLKDVDATFKKYYESNALFEIGALARRPQLSFLKKIVGTAKTHISYEVVGQKLFVFSVIDNLLKGAAGQAVENLNRLLDLNTNTSLTSLEAVL